MGCGASSAEEISVVADDKSRPLPATTVNNQQMNNSNGVAGKSRTDKSNSNGIHSPRKPVSKPVAFDINLDENKENNNNSQIIAKKPAPIRFSGLAPLANAPVLTADMLEEKMRAAEENRAQELDKKREMSRRTSRLRQNILRAQEFDKDSEQTKQKVEIEQKMRSADLNRELRRKELEAKKRMREERAKLIRERARRMKDGETSDIEYEIEKDDGFNDDDADSWLGDDDAATQVTEVMSERCGPDGESQYRGLSASTRFTTDSYDIQREQTLMSIRERKNEFDEASRDDFFDT